MHSNTAVWTGSAWLTYLLQALALYILVRGLCWVVPSPRVRFRLLSREGSANNFEINIDAFNVLNHPNFINFVGVRNSALFGEPSVALAGRTIQFSVRYRF